MNNRRFIIPVNEKVVTRDNLGDIYSFLLNEYNRARANFRELSVRLNFQDGEQYQFEAETLEYFLAQIDEKVLYSLSLELRLEGKYSRSIKVELRQGNYSYNNEFIIMSNNLGWASQIRDKVNRKIESLQNQDVTVSRIANASIHILSILIGYTAIRALEKLVIYMKGVTDEGISAEIGFRILGFIEQPLLEFGGTLIISYLIGFWLLLIFFYSQLKDLIRDTWPQIEFNFGPEHTRTATNRKKLFLTIGGYFLVPIILQIFFKIIGI